MNKGNEFQTCFGKSRINLCRFLYRWYSWLLCLNILLVLAMTWSMVVIIFCREGLINTTIVFTQIITYFFSLKHHILSLFVIIVTYVTLWDYIFLLILDLFQCWYWSILVLQMMSLEFITFVDLVFADIVDTTSALFTCVGVFVYTYTL